MQSDHNIRCLQEETLLLWLCCNWLRAELAKYHNRYLRRKLNVMKAYIKYYDARRSNYEWKETERNVRKFYRPTFSRACSFVEYTSLNMRNRTFGHVHSYSHSLNRIFTGRILATYRVHCTNSKYPVRVAILHSLYVL